MPKGEKTPCHELTEQEFGLWRVLHRSSQTKYPCVMWVCRCKCGREQDVSGSRLVTGKSSGCLWCKCLGRKPLDLTGQKLGPWTPLTPARSRTGRMAWLCRHDDGREAVIASASLRIYRLPAARIEARCRSRIYHAFRNAGLLKNQGTVDLLGCSAVELICHLSSLFRDGMTLENYGNWHIDHIKPAASFDFTDPAQVLECFHYSNLQPMWGRENHVKGAFYGGVSYNRRYRKSSESKAVQPVITQA